MLLAALLLACTFGCTTSKNQDYNPQVATNTVPLAAFNDEEYVWENWSFGTNQVDSAEITK